MASPMQTIRMATFCCITLLLFYAQVIHSNTIPRLMVLNPTITYIIHTNHLSRPARFATQAQWYNSIVTSLPLTNTSANAGLRRIFYTYETIMHGFAAVLSPEEARWVSKTPGVIGVYQDRVVRLQTTRSPSFLGLDMDFGLWPEADFGDDIIIGLVDTGIWPESASFNDAGLGPVGPGWRGKCENDDCHNASFCNNKIVGARSFTSGIEAQGWLPDNGDDYRSARDSLGHGTHTSSIAAGSAVPNANLFGFANGTARGMAPRAKLAMYKACGSSFCADSDILMAIDAAVHDGVHVLSMSIGGAPREYYEDVLAIGTFAAVRNGIFVACSAGNSGPSARTVTNLAPWITTVGAGTVDRSFPVRVTLGNGQVLDGESLYDMVANQTDMIPLVLLDFCFQDYDLVPDKIIGKIAVCYHAGVDTGISVQEAGGAGLISLNYRMDGEEANAWGFTLPALSLGYTASQQLMSYINSTRKPVASFRFECRTVIGANRAPAVAAYSSRGPSSIVPEILKPDILAPGSSILGAWPTESPLSFSDRDARRAGFNIISGTSMSCPHIAGIAALLKRANPKWSPAMIRSALMTTAVALDNDFRHVITEENSTDATPLAAGAGHVHPQLARDPGLVYDAGIQDYIDLLCSLNYTKEQLFKFGVDTVNCTRKLKSGPGDLNYPSFAVAFDNNTNARVLTRTVTKVSDAPETYKARVVVSCPDKVTVAVTPERLEFKEVYEKRSYQVEFRSKVAGGNVSAVSNEFGYIVWESEVHQVKSPVVFMWN